MTHSVSCAGVGMPGGCDCLSACHADRQIESGACRRAPIDDHGIDVRSGDDRREVIGIGVERQDSETARDALQLDQSERGGELAAGGDNNGFAGKFREPAAENRAAGKIGDAGAPVAIEEELLRRADVVPQRLRLNVRHFRRLSRNRRKSRETARLPTP